MKIDHISISRDSIYSECPQKYKFRYHLNVIPDVETPFYFTFGKIIHKIIEEHSKLRGEKSISRIKSEILSGQIELEPGKKAPPLENRDHVRLASHLRNYMRLVEKIGYDGEIEWYFNYDLDPPNKKTLVGVIDRLIIKDNSAYVIDYKTTKPSKWRKDHTTITKDTQLACYCYVVSKTYGIPPKSIKAALYYLEDAKLVPVIFSEKSLASVPTYLLNAYNKIQLANPDEAVGNVGDHCRRCEYRRICPFYALI